MATASPTSRTDPAIAALIGGTHRDPFAVLGPHSESGGIVVRAFHPSARAVDLRLVATGALLAMTKRDEAGLYELRLDDAAAAGGVPDYRLRITYPADHVVEIDDPYRYGRVLTDYDLHLLGEGTHHRAFEKLGSHRITVGTTSGVHFAVWAPNADRVSVIGDFNGWDGRVHPMRILVPNGIWEIFLPDLPDTSSRRPTRSRAPSRRRRSRPPSSATSRGTSGTTPPGSPRAPARTRGSSGR
jgi:1,4-alpha-glucan branching enzyme